MVDEIKKKNQDKMMASMYYKIGSQRVDTINDQTDTLLNKHSDIQTSDSMNDWFNKRVALRKKRKRNKVYAWAISIACILIISISTNQYGPAVLDAMRDYLVNDQHMNTSIEHSPLVDIEIFDDLPESWTSYYYPTKIVEGYTFSNAREEDEKRIIEFVKGEDTIVFIQSSMPIEIFDDSFTGVYMGDYDGWSKTEDSIVSLYWSLDDLNFKLKGPYPCAKLLEIQDYIIKTSE